MMSLGKGAVSIFSTIQKINAKLSTEEDLIGMYDSMAKILWKNNSSRHRGKRLYTISFYRITRLPYS